MSKVSVSLRLRPTDTLDAKLYHASTGSGTFDISIPHHHRNTVKHTFDFDRVLTDSSQEDVFNLTCPEIIDDAFKGISGNIIAYGQTGAGKTYTIAGSTTNFHHRGIIPRVLHSVFQQIEKRSDYNISVHVSYLEIANDAITDLLATSPSQLLIIDDEKLGVRVRGLILDTTRTPEEALESFSAGFSNRKTASHAFNEDSSRGHTIFSVHLEIKSANDSSSKSLVSQINIVDLAGSERVCNSGSEGEAKNEASQINKSLMYLEQVVLALQDGVGSQKHVPFRTSKLTHLLKDSLTGLNRTAFLICIWPEARFLEETLSTLRFAQKAARLEHSCRTSIVQSDEQLIKSLQQEIKLLRKDLHLQDAISGRKPITYAEPTKDDLRDMRVTVQQYLGGSLDMIDVDSIHQAGQYFGVFRSIFESHKVNFTDAAPEEPEPVVPTEPSKRSTPLVTNDPASFIAEDESRPPVSMDDPLSASTHKGSLAAQTFSALELYKLLTEKQIPAARQKAFESFRVADEMGKSLDAEFAKETASAREKLKTLNDFKRETNQLREEIIKMKADNSQAADFDGLVLKHRERIAQCKALQADYDGSRAKVEDLKTQLLGAFSGWSDVRMKELAEKAATIAKAAEEEQSLLKHKDPEEFNYARALAVGRKRAMNKTNSKI